MAKNGPTRAQVRVALDELAKAAETFMDAVRKVDEGSLAFLTYTGGEFGSALAGEAVRDVPFDQRALHLLSNVAELANESRRAADHIRSGQPDDPAWIYNFILDFAGVAWTQSGSAYKLFVRFLADTFEAVTGDKAKCYYDAMASSGRYAGNFLPFLRACSELLPIDEQLRNAMGQTAKEALEDRRKWKRQ